MREAYTSRSGVGAIGMLSRGRAEPPDLREMLGQRPARDQLCALTLTVDLVSSCPGVSLDTASLLAFPPLFLKSPNPLELRNSLSVVYILGGKAQNLPTNKKKTQPRPMNRFEISLGPVWLANTTPESTCKQGRGREEEVPREPQRPSVDEAGGARRGQRGPGAQLHLLLRTTALWERLRLALLPFLGGVSVCVQIRLSGR